MAQRTPFSTAYILSQDREEIEIAISFLLSSFRSTYRKLVLSFEWRIAIGPDILELGRYYATDRGEQFVCGCYY